MSREQRCTECRRPASEVGVLIVGRHMNICEGCLANCLGSMRHGSVDLAPLCAACPNGGPHERREEAKPGKDDG